MAQPRSVDKLLKLVCKSGLVEPERLTAYVEGARAAAALPDKPEEMARALVRDGLLTRYQAEHLLRGKHKRFVLGKYKILERLGSGGMGRVYLCEHMQMRRRVAIKVLPPARANEPCSLERFYREARAVAALDHPNIVRAHDIDRQGRFHFLVMEYVDGSGLEHFLKTSKPLDPIRAAHYIAQAAAGLQHAHEAGFVHRDIKPANLLLQRSGTVKILDLGLARFFHDQRGSITKQYDPGCVLGTADYLAPEQAVTGDIDIRSDIYSLGMTFYALLSGDVPFPGGTVREKFVWQQVRMPRPIREFRPDVPGEMAAVVEKMIAKDPANRYQAPSEVVEALAPWAEIPIPKPSDDEMPRLSPAAMADPKDSPSLPALGSYSSADDSRFSSASPVNTWPRPAAVATAVNTDGSGASASTPPRTPMGVTVRIKKADPHTPLPISTRRRALLVAGLVTLLIFATVAVRTSDGPQPGNGDSGSQGPNITAENGKNEAVGNRRDNRRPVGGADTVFFFEDFVDQEGNVLKTPPSGNQWIDGQKDTKSIAVVGRPGGKGKCLQLSRQAQTILPLVVGVAEEGSLVAGKTISVVHHVYHADAAPDSSQVEVVINPRDRGNSAAGWLVHGGYYHYRERWADKKKTNEKPSIGEWDTLEMIVTFAKVGTDDIGGTYDLFLTKGSGKRIALAQSVPLNANKPADTCIRFRLRHGWDGVDPNLHSVYFGDIRITAGSKP